MNADAQTIYVAGPMTGIPEFNYPAFNRAATALGALGFKVLNPVTAEAENPTPGEPQTWEWYMRRALRMVTHADGVALLPGWKTSRGARLEVDVAIALNLDVKLLAEWVNLFPPEFDCCANNAHHIPTPDDDEVNDA